MRFFFGIFGTVHVVRAGFSEISKKQLQPPTKKLSNTNVNNGAIPVYKTLAENEYDKLGQLKKKKLAPGYNSGAGLETLNYDYNIRGWMLGMNRDYARDASSSNYFGFDLGYDKASNNLIGGQTYANPQYNGNIEGMVWKSKGDGEKRKYDFYYDAANRLLRGDFTQYTSGTFSQSAGVNYNMKMGDGINVTTAYDDNGNIKRMQQWGLKITGSMQIDDLNYQYINGSNKLKSVTELTLGGTDNKLGDFTDKNATNDDYSYDVNGNLAEDKNKAISSITYNHLNLPSVITVTGKGTISYTYDAAGNKLKKEVAETGQPVKTTLYIGSAVFENDVLQFIGHEEGRFRPSTVNGQLSVVYDYMLKDHLGNVRMLLTEEQKQDKYPVASMEDAKQATEQLYYTINTGSIMAGSTVSGLPTYTNDNGIGNNPSDPPFETANSQKLYKINGNDASKTGLGITLKVMAGDKIDIFGKSYYFQSGGGGQSTTTPAAMVLEILNGLLGGPTGGAAGAAHGGVTATQLNGLPATTGGISNMINQQASGGSGDPLPPRAYINCIFFDEQFKFVDGFFSQSGTQNQLKDHFSELQNKVAQKNGYVYIYVSNESPVNVFFDNLQVVHTRGAILEETHYYPFGLTMNAISNEAFTFGDTKNRMKYQGQEIATKEFSDGTGLGVYEFRYRMDDPQTGRFWQVDPMASQYAGNSVYAFAENRIINGVDLEGLEWAKVTDGSKTIGYMWDPENAYDADNKLKDGYFRTAIYFTDNGTFDQNTPFNMGSATATVFKADGTTEEFEACIYPANLTDFPSIPEGDYLAATGPHKNQYTALHMTNSGEFENAVVNLGFPNPNSSSNNYGKNIADGIHIHHAGSDNKTGQTNDGRNISEACLLINTNRWNEFIKNFLKGKSTSNSPTSVTISRSSAKPKKYQRFRVPMASSSITNIVRWNAKTKTYQKISEEEFQAILNPPSLSIIDQYNIGNIRVTNK